MKQTATDKWGERWAAIRAVVRASSNRRAYFAARYVANREKIKASSRAYRAANPERVLAANRAYDAAHRDEDRAYSSAYAAAHPDATRARYAARRARKFGNGGSHTLAEWLDKCALLGNVCFYCGEAKPLTRDHNTPLTRGGTDNISNILPACRSCNCRKSTKTAREFLATKARAS